MAFSIFYLLHSHISSALAYHMRRTIGVRCSLLSHRLFSCYCAFGSSYPNLQGIVHHLINFVDFLPLQLPSTSWHLSRWLLANGKTEQLAALIEQAGKWNHRILPSNYRKTLNVSPATVERKVSVFDLFQKDYRLTTLLMFVIWFSIILIYFGITLHMSSLGGNVYINTVSHPSPLLLFLFLTHIFYIDRASKKKWKKKT